MNYLFIFILIIIGPSNTHTDTHTYIHTYTYIYTRTHTPTPKRSFYPINNSSKAPDERIKLFPVQFEIEILFYGLFISQILGITEMTI